MKQSSNDSPETTALFKLALAVAPEKDLETLCNNFATTCLQLPSIQHCSIWLFTPAEENSTRHLVRYTSQPINIKSDPTEKTSDKLLGFIQSQPGIQLLTTDMPLFSEIFLHEDTVTSAVIIPLLTNAVILLGSKEQGYFSTDHGHPLNQIVSRFSQSLEITLNHSRLYEDNQRVTQLLEDQQVITDSAASFIFKCDRSGQLQWFNHQFEQLFLTQLEEAPKNLFQLFPGGEEKKLHQALTAAYMAGSAQLELNIECNNKPETISLNLRTLYTDFYTSIVGSGFIITEEKISDQRARLISAVFESAHDGIIITDIHGHVIEVNDRFKEITRQANDEIASWESVCSALNIDAWNTLNKMGHWEGDSTICVDGQKRHLHHRFTAIHDQEGEISYFVGLVSDTTELYLSQQALHESEAHLKQVIATYPQPILVIDKEHRVTHWNKACEQVFGIPATEILGTRDHWKPFYPHERPLMADIILDDGGDSSIAEYYKGKYRPSPFIEGAFEAEDFFPRIGSDKRGRWLYFTASPIRNAEGEITGAIESLIDITERMEAEEQARTLSQELNHVIETYPQPILVIDKEHRVTHWNKACEKVFGIPAADVVGTRNHWKPFYPEARPLMADIVLDGGNEGKISEYYQGKYRQSPFIPNAFEAEDYFPRIGSDNRGRWLYFTASPLCDASGKVVGAIESLIDITQQKEAESEAKQLNDELESRVIERTEALRKANKELHLAMDQLVHTEKLASLGKLVAGVAHELNTPIGNMLTVGSTLQEYTSELTIEIESGQLRKATLENFLDMTRESTEIIQRSAERAVDLISNFKQVAVDQTSMRRRTFDLNEVIDEVLATLKPGFKRTKHTVENNIPRGIYLDSYPGPLEQVISNLVHNSLIHGFEQIDSGSIVINAESTQSEVVISYRDNGMGMDKQTVSHAFDPFFTTKLGKGGSGLGLYVSYNLVTAVLGGTLTLESDHEQGVLFLITLPLNAPHQDSGDKEI